MFQGSLVSAILFFIYISGVFNKVLKISFLIISLFFINNLVFIAFGNLVKEMIRTFKQIAKQVIK